MKVNPVTIFIQVAVGVGLYFVFASYDLVWLYLVIVAITFVGLVIYNMVHVKSMEMYMDLACNPTMYIQKIEKRQSKRTPKNAYHLSLAYAHVYKGKYEEAKTYFDQVDIKEINDQERYYPIYVRVATKLAYHEGNQLILETLYNQLVDMENSELLLGFVETYQLLSEEKYDEIITLLMEFIPKQKSRLVLIELEYYLGLCYTKRDRIEDALAVLEFIVKKGFQIEYTDLAYELYLKVKE